MIRTLMYLLMLLALFYTPGLCEGSFYGECSDDGQRGLFESRLWSSQQGGNGSGFSYVGTTPGHSTGYYEISNLPAGTYCLGMSRPRFLRGFVVENIVLTEGANLQRNIQVHQNYAVNDVSMWDGGQVFWQTFVANGDSVIAISIYTAATPGGTGSIDPSALISLHDGYNGSQIGPNRRIGTQTANGTYNRAYVNWQSGEVPTAPGHTYAVRIEGQVRESINGPWVAASWSSYTVPGDQYAQGQMYIDGTPRPDRDMNLTIACDDDGLLSTILKPVHLDTNYAEGLSPGSFGQTFTARGYGVAVADFKPTLGWGHPVNAQIQLFTYSGNPSSPKGAPIGMAKHMLETSDVEHGVVYGQGEVPLTPGNSYYMECTKVGGGFIQAYYATDFYTGGNLYIDSIRMPGSDLDTVIMEYKTPKSSGSSTAIILH